MNHDDCASAGGIAYYIAERETRLKETKLLPGLGDADNVACRLVLLGLTRRLASEILAVVSVLSVGQLVIGSEEEADDGWDDGDRCGADGQDLHDVLVGVDRADSDRVIKGVLTFRQLGKRR